MAGGPWGTGTWDSAQWDSLPVTNNVATGGVGTLGASNTAALTGVSATGAVGTIGLSISLSVTGNSADGNVGTLGASISSELAGVSATGNVGSVGATITVAISGVSATGDVGTVTSNSQPIIIDDTHDGDGQKKRFLEELKRKERKRLQLIEIYEDLLEAKPEVVKPIVAKFVQKTTKHAVPTINFEALLADLDKVEALYKEHREMDDEEVLLLL